MDHQIVTPCIAMVNVVSLLFIWKEMAWKILNLENFEFYTCTQWDYSAKFLIMAYKVNSLMPNHCILVGLNETKWTTFDFMRNDVLQNYLLQYLADNFHFKFHFQFHVSPLLSEFFSNSHSTFYKWLKLRK